MSNQFQVALLILQFAFLLCSSARAQEQKQAQRSIPELIQELGSAKFHEREAAQKALLSRDEAYPDLRRALPKLNAEGRYRANAILDAMTKRRMKRFLQYGREGRVDVFVEWSGVAGNNIDAIDYWDCVIEIGLKQLNRAASKETIRKWAQYFPAKNYAQFLKERPNFIRVDDTIETAKMATHLALRECSGKKAPLALSCSLIVTNSPLDLDCFAMHTIILTTGKFKLRHCASAIVISDEDVPGRFLSDSIIATRYSSTTETGLFRDPMRARPAHSAAKSARATEDIEEYDLLLRPGEPLRRIYVPASASVERSSVGRVNRMSRRSDGLCFFEFEDLGIECSFGIDGPDQEREVPEAFVKVNNVDRKSPFAKAGLATGDIITAVDGIDTDGIDTARRQLRHAFVLGGTELKISRHGKPMTLNVNFFGWELPALGSLRSPRD